MKFTLSWLKDHLETTATLDDILFALTDLGHEVEGVENPADTLGAFRICRVIESSWKMRRQGKKYAQQVKQHEEKLKGSF